MASSFTLRGASEMTRRMRDLQRKFPDDARRALHDEAADVLAASQEVVPVETGALKATGRIAEVETPDKEIAVAVTYGDETVQYAAAVHEVGPSEKYLERPLRDAVQGMNTRIAERIQREVDR